MCHSSVPLSCVVHPCAGSLHSTLEWCWGFGQVFEYKVTPREWEAFKKMIVGGIYECVNWRAEHALVHVLQLSLCVGYDMYVAGVMSGLCSNMQRV